ncbi:MAG TPA: CpaF family protein [Candidatus Dormibacteraeota bacterium]|jgi:pilus assembly protein CpaF|nr:CpaF family protein [Candidatus Dormibacteraeota bacterium]
MSLLDRVQRHATGEEAPPAPPPSAPAPPGQPASGAEAGARAEAGAPGGRLGSPLLNRTGASRSVPGRSGLNAQYGQLRAVVHQRLVDEMLDTDSTSRDSVAAKLGELVTEIAVEMSMPLARQDKQRIVEQLINDVLGLGPLEGLLADPDVTEVMVNGPSQIFVEKSGKLHESTVTFENTEQLMLVIDRIVSGIGRRVDESSPMVDARLKDGSRVNVIIPPLALRGPTVTIRKFSKDPYTVDDLIRFGSATPEMFDFLRACVRSRLNVVVSGGTGSGKTTTLNILSGFIPDDERIVTIEDAAELQLRQEHVVTLETRPANVEGRGSVRIRELVINALRMRPDRIVVGECRSGEALDMLQAMNTGHDGSLTTVHANSPADALSRLETMVLMAGAELPSRAIREQIASAVNIICHQMRLRDGTRRITAITEVLGFDGEHIDLQDIFVFKQTGVNEDGRVLGALMPTGATPHYLEHIVTSGEGIDVSMFAPSRPAVVGAQA